MEIEERAELLAAAEHRVLLEVAERLIGKHGLPEIIAPPTVGLIALEVREPVERIRFRLGDVVVTRAEVEIRGGAGWGIRAGDDRAGSLAAAVCAAVGDHGLEGHEEVDRLCQATADRIVADDLAEWAELAETIVEFEELD